MRLVSISKTKSRIIVRLIEFFILGVVMGISEDLIAIRLATEAEITWHVFKTAFLVAIPFAVISEIVADSKIFRREIEKILKVKRK